MFAINFPVILCVYVYSVFVSSLNWIHITRSMYIACSIQLKANHEIALLFIFSIVTYIYMNVIIFYSHDASLYIPVLQIQVEYSFIDISYTVCNSCNSLSGFRLGILRGIKYTATQAQSHFYNILHRIHTRIGYKTVYTSEFISVHVRLCCRTAHFANIYLTMYSRTQFCRKCLSTKFAGCQAFSTKFFRACVYNWESLF